MAPTPFSAFRLFFAPSLLAAMLLSVRLIKETAISVSGLPILTAVIAASCEVVDGARKASSNKDAFKSLARRVSELVEAVTAHCDELGTQLQYSTDFLVFLEELGHKVSEILQFVELHAHQSQLRALLYKDREAQVLARFEEDVGQALRLFHIQTEIFLQKSELNRLHILQGSDVFRTLESQVDELSTYLGDQRTARPSRNEGYAVTSRPRLPARPAFLFGRDAEIDALTELICNQGSPPGRAAILGGPGIGKTSLVLSVLHHARIVRHFGDRRLFVACDGATSSESLLHLLLGVAGLSCPSSTRAAERTLTAWLGEAECPTLIVLDNFESAWEPPHSRNGVESLLSALSVVPYVSIVITMRGTERPQGIAWTRPFLPVLSPLNEPAARQVFTSIAEADSDPDMDQLLSMADGLPLAVVLLANMAQSEPCGALLQRWHGLSTSLLAHSDGGPSILGRSVSLSLQSPRVCSSPNAIAVLSLLSLLPDGLRQSDIGAALPVLPNVLRCLSCLLQSALAYSTSLVDGRIRVLAPIRVFMLQNHAPQSANIQPLYEHYVSAAEAFRAYPNVDSTLLDMITHEQGNFDSVIRHALACRPDARTVRAVHALALFYWRTRLGPPRLVEAALEAARLLGDQQLEIDTMLCAARWIYAGIDPGLSNKLFVEAHKLSLEAGYTDGRVLAVGSLAKHSGDRPLVDEAEAALAGLRACNNVDLLLTLLLCVGKARMSLLELDRATAHYQETIDIFRSMPHPDPSLYARALGELGEILVARGRTREALELFEIALPFTQQRVRQPVDEADCHRQVGMAHIAMGEHRRGLHFLSTALALYRTGRAVMLEVAALVFISWSQAALGDLDAAESTLTAANIAVLKIPSQWPWGRTMCSYAWSDIIFYRGDVIQARVVAQTARNNFRRDEHLEYEAGAIRRLGTIEQVLGDHAEAADLFLLAAIINRKTQEFTEMLVSLNMLADGWLAQGEHDACAAVTHAILPHLCRVANGKELSDARLRFARIAFKHGEDEKAQELCRAALNEYERLEWGPGAKQCNELLAIHSTM